MKLFKLFICILLLITGCKTIDSVPSTVSIFYKGIMTNPNSIMDLANNYPDFVDNKYLNDRMKDKEYLRKEKEFIFQTFQLSNKIDELISYSAAESDYFIRQFKSNPILSEINPNNIIRVSIRKDDDFVLLIIIKQKDVYYLFDLDSGSIAVL